MDILEINNFHLQPSCMAGTPGVSHLEYACRGAPWRLAVPGIALFQRSVNLARLQVPFPLIYCHHDDAETGRIGLAFQLIAMRQSYEGY
jgi:hypothetical protein